MSVAVVNASGDQDIDGLLWGWRYSQTNIAFSFPTSSAEYSGYAQVNGFQAFTAFQQNAVRQALNGVAAFANITFSETTNTGAQFRFGRASSIDYADSSAVAQDYGLHNIATAEGNPPALADGSTPPYSPAYAQGDTWFNPTGYTNPTTGSYQDAAGIMHEIGHDMGLKHGHVTQVGHGVTFPTLPTNHGSYEYSVMTYQQFPDDSASDGDSAPDHPTTYMQDDIAAMQYMYGANYNTNNGATTYTWNAVTGQESINGVAQTDLNGEVAPADGEILMTVWDGGGADTYDLSNFTTNLSVDLSPGGWTVLDTSAAHRQRADLGYDRVTSSEYYARGNIANAQLDPNNPNETASLIENAFGGSGSDTIAGNSANNVLKGGGGDDTLEGGEGSDTLYGGNPFVSSGADGDDTLKGGGGNDFLYGGSGDDSLKGGGGADYLDGGTGVNTADYSYSSTSAGVYVNLATGVGLYGDAQGDTLVNIQIVDGSAYADTLIGNALVNTLEGAGGDDYIYAGGAGSTLDGGAGVDMLSFYYLTSGVTVDLSNATAPGGAAAGDTISNFENLDGGKFNDTLSGTSGVNYIYGEGGDDVINAGDGADFVYAGDGDDTVIDTDYVNFDSYNGGAGVNTIDYSRDTFSAGVVTINLATGLVTVNTSGGNTEAIVNFQNVEGSQGGETIIGSDANNRLDGNGGNDVISGGGGDDILIGGTGADALDGGTGVNTADYSTSSTAVSVNLTTGAGSGGDAQGDTLVNIQNLAGGGFGDTLTGDANANVINGGAGADVMQGMGGDDTYYVDNAGDVVKEAVGGGVDRVYTSVGYALASGSEIETLSTTNDAGTGAINLTGNAFGQTLIGDAGANVINGGGGTDVMQGLGGNDAYYVDNAGDVVTEAVGGGSDRVYTSVSYVLTAGSEIEAFSTTNNAGTGAINLTGDAFGQTIAGNNGANVINGGGGADVMKGFGGNDSYIVDNSGDVVTEAVGGGSDRVYTSVSYVLTAGSEIEAFSTTNNAGTGAINLTGDAFGQTIAGNNGANVINGGGGADVMKGFGGNDTYIVDNAGDVVTEAVGGGSDRVYTSVSYVLTAGSEIEAFSTANNAGTGAINLTGNAFGQTIAGNAGANVIDGGGGSDILKGLGGADTFKFDTALGPTNVDQITDFATSANHISLAHSIFTTLATGTLAAADFFIGTAAQNASEHILYNASDGWLSYDSDGNGSAAATHFATLSKALALSSTNFTVS